MQILIRNVDSDLANMLKVRQKELQNQGIKLNQSEMIIELLKQALTTDFLDYKKDIFDTTIATLTDKFQEYIDTNNEILTAISGVEVLENEEQTDARKSK